MIWIDVKTKKTPDIEKDTAKLFNVVMLNSERKTITTSISYMNEYHVADPYNSEGSYLCITGWVSEFYHDYLDEISSEDVLFWQPLPEPPK